jgi:type II secretory pathway pseudopilin PulG
LKRRGATLIELLVVLSLFTLVIVGVFRVWSATEMQQRSMLTGESREQATAALDTLAAAVMASEYYFPGYQGLVNNVSIQVPGPGGTGSALACAAPETGVAGSETYTITVAYSAPLSPPDRRNPQAQELVVLRYRKQKPPTADDPSSFRLSSLTGPARKEFRTYHQPGSWSVASSTTGNSFTMNLNYRFVPSRGPVFQGTMGLRATRRIP